jgi:hypothetical protein
MGMNLAEKSTMLRGALTLLALLALAVPVHARVLSVGPGQDFANLAQAEAQSRPGDVIRLSTGTHQDCVVLRQPDITLEGTGRPEDTTLSGVACQGKAAVVTAAPRITLRNLTLAHISVPDGNGAGIRAEGGDLLVDHVHFVLNENGILTAGDTQASIIIRDSEFVHNGSCVQACAHGVYIGHVGLVRIERSQFLATSQGHHIKSRALRTEIIDCEISDGTNGTASYAIDIPNGGELLVRNASIQKGPHSGNHSAAISIGAEGVTQPTPSLRIESSWFRRDGEYPTVFVRNLSTTPAELVGNQFAEGRNSTDFSPLFGPGSVR